MVVPMLPMSGGGSPFGAGDNASSQLQTDNQMGDQFRLPALNRGGNKLATKNRLEHSSPGGVTGLAALLSSGVGGAGKKGGDWLGFGGGTEHPPQMRMELNPLAGILPHVGTPPSTTKGFSNVPQRPRNIPPVEEEPQSAAAIEATFLTDPPAGRLEAERAHIEAVEQSMELMRHNRHANDSLLMECWLNDALLQRAAGALQEAPDVLKVAPEALTGLSSFGLTRRQLQSAGLTAAGVDKLYRSLYVYTVGFHDTLQEHLKHCADRARLMKNVWRSFVTVAEKSLKTTWKSEFLEYIEGPSWPMRRLALSASVQHTDRNEAAVHSMKQKLHAMEASNQDLESRLTHALDDVATSSARQQELEMQNQSLTQSLEGEKASHAHAVNKFVAETELRTAAQEELIDVRQDMQNVRGEHTMTKHKLEQGEDALLKLRIAHRALTEKFTALERRYLDSKEVFDNAAAERKHAKDEYAKLDAIHSKVSKQLKEELRTKIFLQGELYKKKDKITALTEDIEEVGRQMAHQGRRLVKLTNDHNDLKRTHKDTLRTLRATTERAEMSERDHLTTQARFDDEKQLHSVLKGEHRELTAQHADLKEFQRLTQEKLDAKTQELTDLIRKLGGASVADLSAMIEGRNALAVAFAQETKIMWTVQKRDRRRMRHANRALAELEATKVDLDTWREKFEDLSQSLQEVLAQLEQQLLVIDERERRIAEQESQLELTEAEIEEVKEQKAKEMAEKEAVAMSIREELTLRIQVVSARLKDMDNHTLEMEEQLAEKTELADSLDEELGKLRVEHKKTSDALELQMKNFKQEQYAHKSTKQKLQLAENKIPELQQELAEQKELLEQKRTKKKYWKELCIEKTASLENIESMLERVMSKLSETESEHSSTVERVNHMLEQYEALQELHNTTVEDAAIAAKDAADQIADLENQIAELTNDQSNNLDTIARLELEIVELKDAKETLETELAESRATVEQRDETIAHLEKQLAETVAAMEQAAIDAEKAREEMIENHQAECEAKDAVLENEKVARQADLDELNAAMEEMMQKKDKEMEDVREELTIKGLSLQQTLENLKKLMEEEKQAAAENTAELEAKIEKLEAELAELQSELAEAKATIKEQAGTIKQQKSDLNKLPELEIMIDKLREQMGKLKSQSEVERNKLVAEISKKEQMIEKMKDLVADAKADAEAAKKEAEEAHAKSAQLEQDLSDEQSRHLATQAAMEEAAEAAAKALEAAQASKAALHGEYDKLMEKYQEEQKNIKEERKKIEETMKKLEAERKKTEQQMRKNQALLDTEKSDRLREATQASNTIKRLTNQKKEMEEELRAEIKRLEEELKEAKDRIVVLEGEKQDLLDTKAHLEMLLDLEKQEVARRLEELAALQAKHDKCMEDADYDITRVTAALHGSIASNIWLKKLPPRKKKTVSYTQNDKTFRGNYDESMLSCDEQFTVAMLRPMIGEIYLRKIEADISDDRQNPEAPRQTLEQFTYEFFLVKFGLRSYSEAHLRAIVETIMDKRSDPRLNMFGRLLGLQQLEPRINGDIIGESNDFYLNTLALIFTHTGGPSEKERREGSCSVEVEKVLLVVDDVFEKAEQECVQRVKNKLAAYGETNDGVIDLDLVMADIMRAWEEEYRRGEHAMRVRLQAADANEGEAAAPSGTQLYTVAQFNQVLAGVAPGIARKTLRGMFREALDLSSHTDRITPEAFVTVMRRHGYISISKRRNPHPEVVLAVEFDEFPFIQESWDAMRDKVFSVLGEITGLKTSRGTPVANELQRQVDSFQDLLTQRTTSSSVTSDPVWSLYRKLIITYSSHVYKLTKRKRDIGKLFKSTVTKVSVLSAMKSVEPDGRPPRLSSHSTAPGVDRGPSPEKVNYSSDRPLPERRSSTIDVKNSGVVRVSPDKTISISPDASFIRRGSRDVSPESGLRKNV